MKRQNGGYLPMLLIAQHKSWGSGTRRKRGRHIDKTSVNSETRLFQSDLFLAFHGLGVSRQEFDMGEVYAPTVSVFKL